MSEPQQRPPAGRLVVFGDDWGRHPSTIQHLVRGLLPRYEVDWVNTVGTRQPRPSLADLRRGIEKLVSWTAPRPAAAPASGIAPAVHSPVHWPSFRRPWERRLNRALLLPALREVLTRAPTPAAIVTTIAITADVASAYRDLNWVYFCQDEFPEWPDLDSATLLAMEAELLPLMRAVVAVSDNLQQRFRCMGYDCAIVTPGIDLAMWRGIARRPLPSGARPVATFWGLADARLDVAVCAAIAEHCDLVIVGPQARVAPALLRNPGIRWHGAVPHAELPRIAGGSDVLVMPYGVTPATRAMQPLKLKEYLATGLPVVATRLPATEPWADALDLASGPDDFVGRIIERAHAPLPHAQREARRRLADEGWEVKSQEFERLLLDGPASAGASNRAAVPLAQVAP